MVLLLLRWSLSADVISLVGAVFGGHEVHSSDQCDIPMPTPALNQPVCKGSGLRRKDTLHHNASCGSNIRNSPRRCVGAVLAIEKSESSPSQDAILAASISSGRPPEPSSASEGCSDEVRLWMAHVTRWEKGQLTLFSNKMWHKCQWHNRKMLQRPRAHT